MRAADLVIRSLVTAGVERLFTLSGNQIMPVFDASIDQPIELIHVRHEAAAVHMADAVGRLTGEPGIALVTAGPGFANALSALYVAFMAESPLVMISGASPLTSRGRGSFQEMPQAEIAGQFTKASWEVTDPSNIGHDLARAFRTAKTGRPGPVHLAVPGELLERTVLGAGLDSLGAGLPTPPGDRPQVSTSGWETFGQAEWSGRETGPQQRETGPQQIPHADDFAPLTSLLDVTTAEAILAQLGEAENPVILAGPSMARGENPDRLQELAERLNIPAVAMESPRGLKDPSLGRFRDLLKKADVVLLLVRSLNFTVRFGASPAFREDCRFLMIDPEARIIEQANRNLGDESRMVLSDLADPLPAVERLLQLAPETPTRSNSWRREFEEAIGDRSSVRRSQGFPKSLGSGDDAAIHPAMLCESIQEFLTDDDLYIADGGEFGQWAQACLSTRQRVINGPSGSIGGGLSFAFGARCVMPDAKIVACVGDGTFGFHAMEFDTAVRHNLPAVIVVGNDACWNAERQIQLRDYGEDRQIGCDLLPTRYDEIVKSLGGHGEFVTTLDELQPALERAFASNKPACVNVLIESVAAPE